MKIRIKKLPILEAKKLAIKYRLYVPGWGLRWELSEINNSNLKDYKILMVFDNKTPIGICLKRKYSSTSNQLMVFVRKQYRYNGIGRRLVNKIKDEHSYGDIGIKKSNGKIWKLNGILSY